MFTSLPLPNSSGFWDNSTYRQLGHSYLLNCGWKAGFYGFGLRNHS